MSDAIRQELDGYRAILERYRALYAKDGIITPDEQQHLDALDFKIDRILEAMAQQHEGNGTGLDTVTEAAVPEKAATHFDGFGGGPHPDDAPIPRAFHQQSFGKFKVTVLRAMDATGLTTEAYRQYLEMKEGPEATPQRAREFIETNRIQTIMIEGTQTPYDIDPATEWGRTILDQGYVWLSIIPLDLPVRTQEETAALEAEIANLDKKALAELNDLADEEFYRQSQFAYGEKIPSKDHPSAEMWLNLRLEAFELKRKFDALPERLRRFFPLSDQGVPQSIDNLQRVLAIAEKLDRLSDEELDAYFAGQVVNVTNLDVFESNVDAFLQDLDIKKTTGAGEIDWIEGQWTNKQLGTLGNEPIKALDRTSRGLGSLEKAVTFARRVNHATAVVIEDGDYVVYRVIVVDILDPTRQSNNFDISHVDEKDVPGGGPYDTKIKNVVSDCVAIITTGGYIVRIDRGEGLLARHGLGDSPYESPLAAFGPGLSLIKEPKEFEAQLEIVMRDAAYKAVDDAYEFASALEKKLAGPGLSAEERAAMEQAIKNLDQLDDDIEKLEQKIKPHEKKKLEIEEEIERSQERHDPSSEDYEDESRLEELYESLEYLNSHINAVNDEIKQVKSKRPAAAKGFPLALKLGDPKGGDGREERAAFLKLSEKEQIDQLRGYVAKAMSNIRQTRDNIENGEFNVWTMPGLSGAAMNGLGVEGQQLEWAKARIESEKDSERNWAIGEAVVSIGLSIAGGVLGGPLGLVMVAGALALGVHDAMAITNEYQRTGAAAEMSLDPVAMKLVPQDAQPHWSAVALAWIGVGLDAADILRVIGKLNKLVPSSAELKNLSREDFQKKLEGLFENDTDRDAFIDRAMKALKSGRIDQTTAVPVSEEVFNAKFGTTMSEAATMINRKPDGTFDVDIWVREGSSPAVMQEAMKEELRHLEQIANPAFADEVALLTEDAIADWAIKTADEKMRAYRAQLTLEIDSQRKLRDELLVKLEKAETDEDMVKIVAQLDHVEASLASYERKFAEISEGIRTDRPPKWINHSEPPRLFNTPKFKEIAADAEAFFEGKLVNGDKFSVLPPKGHYFIKVGDEYQLKLFPPSKSGNYDPNVTPYRVKKLDNGMYEIEERTAKSAAERRTEIEKAFGDDSGYKNLESTFDALGFDPYKKAYCRVYEEAFRELERRGIDPADLLSGLETIPTKSTFEKSLRVRIRDHAIKVILDTSIPAENRYSVLTDFLDEIPDSAAQGKLFNVFRENNLPTGLQDLKKAGQLNEGDTTFFVNGKKFQGDGVVELTAPPGGPGPRKSGKYLIEDKATLDAFRPAQAEGYSQALEAGKIATGNPRIVAQSGKELLGVIYFFPRQDDAVAAMRRIISLPNSEHIHVAHFLDGELHWVDRSTV